MTFRFAISFWWQDLCAMKWYHTQGLATAEFTHCECGGAKCRRVIYAKILTEISFRPRAQYLKNILFYLCFRHSGHVVENLKQWDGCWHGGLLTFWQDNGLVVETVGLSSIHWAFHQHCGPDAETAQWACCQHSGPIDNLKQWAYCRDSGPDVGTVGLLTRLWASCRHNMPGFDPVVNKTVSLLSKQWTWSRHIIGPVDKTVYLLSKR